MQSLINKIDDLNNELIIGIKDTYKAYGLTKETVRNNEKQNFEISSKNQVIIDDSYKSFLYHKLKGTTFKTLQERGKKRIYMANTSIDLICYSELIDFDEHIFNRISNANVSQAEIIISNTDYDSDKIISQETSKKDFDFHKYLFVVNYQILYKTDYCDESCQ